MGKAKSGGFGWLGALTRPLLVPIALIAGVVGLSVYAKNTMWPPSHGGWVSIGPTVKDLEKLGDITVLKLTVSDVMEGNKYGYKGAWLVKGDVLYSVDMTKATVVSRSDGDREATIMLPLPKAVQPRVDHSRTRTYSVARTSWLPSSDRQSQLRDESMNEAQKLVERAASTDEYITLAKRNAEMLVTLMYNLVDWDVKVVWGDPTLGPPAGHSG